MSVFETRIWNCIGDFNLPIPSNLRMQPFGDFDLSLNKRNKVINAYDDFVQSKRNAGWPAYLTTFMFSPLSGSYSSRLNQMKKAIEKSWSRLSEQHLRVDKWSLCRG